MRGFYNDTIDTGPIVVKSESALHCPVLGDIPSVNYFCKWQVRAAAIRRTLAASGNTFVGKRFGKHLARTKLCLMETFNDLRFTICLTMKV